MVDFYLRLNALVPSPKCRTKNNVIAYWNDERPQPTNEQLAAVDVVAIKLGLKAKKEEIDGELDGSAFNNITFAQAETFVDANITDAGTALVAKKIARLLIAIGKKQGFIN